MEKHALCQQHELEDASGREFQVNGNSYVVINHQQQLFAYSNVCPHVGTPLNWMPGQFLDRDKQFIQCASHGALFEIDSGHCVAGPCQGQSLKPVPLQVEQDTVYLLL